MAGPKFGSPAWRKKYARKLNKRKAKRKTAKRKTKNPRRRTKSAASTLKKIKALLK
jgi:hypothetical protein